MTFRHRASSMDINHQAIPLEAQPTGVPVDHRDPNHPHFPGDIEAQPAKRPLVSKKAGWIAAGVLWTVISIVAAILVGGKIGMGMAKKPIAPIVNATASAEVETVFATTIANSTSLVYLSITPDPTTISTTTMISISVNSAAITSMPSSTPTLTPSPTATSTPTPAAEAPKAPTSEPKQEGSGGGGKQCFTYGNFATQSNCEATCGVMDKLTNDKSVHCEVDSRAKYQCVVCKK